MMNSEEYYNRDKTVSYQGAFWAFIAGFMIIFMLAAGCSKPQDDVVKEDIYPQTVTLSVSLSKLQSQQSDFGVSNKGCVFPAGLDPVDLTKNYLTFESLDTGDIQEVTIEGLEGSFEVTIYGNNYNLTATTYSDTTLPDYTDQYYWYGEVIIDLNVSSEIALEMENPYSGIVVVNNELDIASAPLLGGNLLYDNADGWYIFSKVVGEESLVITRAIDLTEETILFSFDPTIIYTYMFCDPVSLALTLKTSPFTLNKQIILH